MKIIVVGATGTIGKKVSAAFAKDHDVIHAGSKSGQVQVDITSPSSIENFFRKVGKFDALISTAGGGGSYTLRENVYEEHLEYCSARDWEGNDFKFTVTINGDTLIQRGIEKVENAGVDRINEERYIRLPSAAK